MMNKAQIEKMSMDIKKECEDLMKIPKTALRQFHIHLLLEYVGMIKVIIRILGQKKGDWFRYRNIVQRFISANCK